MFENINATGLGNGRNTANKVSTLVERINTNMDIVSDKNYLYIKNGLYYNKVEKQEFIREFIPLFHGMSFGADYEGNNYAPKFGKQAWEHIISVNYQSLMDNYPNLIPFKNGVYNTENGQFSTNTDDLFISSHFSFSYKDAPECENFITTMKQIIPNEEDRNWFLTYINYAFSGDISLQAAMILMGDGNNGKTALMEFIIRLMGSRATTAKINKLNDESYRCNLKGKTLCYSSEIGGSYLKQEHMENLKEIITEKNKSGRKPYMQLEEWQNTTKFVAATNTLPKLQLFEKAFLRRWKIITFPTDFTNREDRNLFDRLYDNMAGDILSYILQNYNDHTILTIDWEETKAIWMTNSNAVLRFVNSDCNTDGIVPVNVEEHETSIIYTEYVRFCVEEEVAPLSQTYFNRQMTKLGYPPYLEHGSWLYNGITLASTTVMTKEDF